MPFGSEGVEPGIGLALSGGGFRATLFHVGACWRLVELGILSDLTRVSSVSGGSIFAGVLAASWHELCADPSVDNYQRLVVKPLRRFCRQQVDSVAIGEGLLIPWKSISDEVESKFRDRWESKRASQSPQILEAFDVPRLHPRSHLEHHDKSADEFTKTVQRTVRARPEVETEIISVLDPYTTT